MFLTILFAVTFLALSFFSAENLVTTIVGFVVTLIGTQLFKVGTGASGFVSVLLAVGVSFLVAVLALVVSGFLGGSGFSWDALGQSGLQLFALATLAYKAITAAATTVDEL